MYNVESVQGRLFEMQDLGYKEFHQKLIPNLDKKVFIGVRTANLRSLAREMFKSAEYEEFLNSLPHQYLDENNLHAYIIEQIKDFNIAMNYTEAFLPYIDNWATCDTFSPKVFKKYPDELYKKILVWLKSKETYTVRYATGILLSNYLDSEFKDEMLDLVSDIRSDEYYVNMMIAWYFATALVKQYDKSLAYIENGKLDKWTHNKAIQKSVESLRISKETKDYLKNLKIR